MPRFGSDRPTINTGRILFLVAILASSSYLVTELFTEHARGKFLAEKVKSKTAELLSRDAELTKLSLKELDLLEELVKKDKEKKDVAAETHKLQARLDEKEAEAKKIEQNTKDRQEMIENSARESKQNLEKAKQEVEDFKKALATAQEEGANAAAGLEAKRALLISAKQNLEAEKTARVKAENEAADSLWQLKQCNAGKLVLDAKIRDLEKEKEEMVQKLTELKTKLTQQAQQACDCSPKEDSLVSEAVLETAQGAEAEEEEEEEVDTLE